MSNVPVRFDDPRPPYLQLASELREAIQNGDYQPGDRLPSTRQLADANGIAPMTVQHALQVLRDEGLVVGHRGRGVFVQEPKDRAPSAEADDAATSRWATSHQPAAAGSDETANAVRDDLDTALRLLDAEAPRSSNDALDVARKHIQAALAALDASAARGTDPGHDPESDAGLSAANGPDLDF